MEEFRDIPGYNNYQISKCGVVIRKSDGHIMCDHVRGPKGRPTVQLGNGVSQKKLLVSRLVAITFIPNDDPAKIEVDHIDRNPFNNCVNNLRWVTKSENCQNRDNISLSHNFDGKRRKRAVKCIIPETLEEIIFESFSAAATYVMDTKGAKSHHACSVNIQACCDGKQKTCFGYKFEYHNN